MTRHHETNGSSTTSGDPPEFIWPLLHRLSAHGLPPERLAALPRSRSARVVALARLARHQEAAALSLLGLLAPQLAAIRRRLIAFGIAPDEAESVTLSVGWEVATGRRLQRCPRSARALAEAMWRAARQEAGLRRRRLVTAPLPERLDLPERDHDPLERWPGLLAAAVAAGIISPRQLVIVARTRMEERTLAEVARELGRPYDAVRMERHRAERALRTFALSYEWSGS